MNIQYDLLGEVIQPQTAKRSREDLPELPNKAYQYEFAVAQYSPALGWFVTEQKSQKAALGYFDAIHKDIPAIILNHGFIVDERLDTSTKKRKAA